jgi:hypothetical protein
VEPKVFYQEVSAQEGAAFVVGFTKVWVGFDTDFHAHVYPSTSRFYSVSPRIYC